MFEIVGLSFGIAFLFLLAFVAGSLFVLLSLALIPKGGARRAWWVGSAFAIPPAALVYVLVCAALLPGESLFGDIDQPLPNGSSLQALSKMPEYGTIDKTGPSIESLDVNGSLIAARVCRDCNDAFVSSAGGPYLLLDTSTKQRSYYDNEAELSKKFGRKPQLVENALFQSREPEYLSQKRFDQRVMFIPPILFSLLFYGWLVRRRLASSARAQHLY